MEEFNRRISERVNLATGSFQLIYAGKPLEESNTLQYYHDEYELTNESTFSLTVRLKGG